MAVLSVHSLIHPSAGTARLRLAGTVGMLILPVFALTVVVLTWLEWDFLHGTGWTVVHEHGVNYPSALARGDLGVFQQLNFLLVGVFAVVFGQGLRTRFTHRWSGGVAAVGFAMVGLAGFLSMFVTDLPGEPASWHGLLHGIGFLLLMLGCAVTFVASGLALRSAPGWRGFWVYSVANPVVALAVATALNPLGQVSFYVLVGLLLGWFGVMGFRLRQLADRSVAG